MTEPAPQRNSLRQMNAELMRNTALDALHQLALERPWKDITMDALAKATGVSRQTIYNEFGSRMGVTEAYFLRLAILFTVGVGMALEENKNDIEGVFTKSFASFIQFSKLDPLVVLLRQEKPPMDLLKLLTVDAGEIDRFASAELATKFQQSWLQLSPEASGAGSRLMLRLCLDYLVREPDNIDQVVKDVSDIFGGFAAETTPVTIPVP